MINVSNAKDELLIGTITETQLQFLIDNMEEESLEDQDYAITPMTLAYFEELGADPAIAGYAAPGSGKPGRTGDPLGAPID